jgi:hypothetical protein
MSRKRLICNLKLDLNAQEKIDLLVTGTGGSVFLFCCFRRSINANGVASSINFLQTMTFGPEKYESYKWIEQHGLKGSVSKKENPCCSIKTSSDGVAGLSDNIKQF